MTTGKTQPGTNKKRGPGEGDLVAGRLLPTAEATRSYFEVSSDFSALGTTVSWEWSNEQQLRHPGYLGLAPGRHEQGRGLPSFAAPPRIVFKKRRRQPMDFYQFDRIWLISHRFKTILEEFDPESFEFAQTETMHDSGTREDPSFWFCDTVRVLDCVDEAASTIRYQEGSPWKTYVGLVKIVMRSDVVGASHAFGLRYRQLGVLVDDLFRDMVHTHKITGFRFIALDGSLELLR